MVLNRRKGNKKGKKEGRERGSIYRKSLVSFVGKDEYDDEENGDKGNKQWWLNLKKELDMIINSRMPMLYNKWYSDSFVLLV